MADLLYWTGLNCKGVHNKVYFTTQLRTGFLPLAVDVGSFKLFRRKSDCFFYDDLRVSAFHYMTNP